MHLVDMPVSQVVDRSNLEDEALNVVPYQQMMNLMGRVQSTYGVNGWNIMFFSY